jgi:hypothetical protein
MRWRTQLSASSIRRRTRPAASQGWACGSREFEPTTNSIDHHFTTKGANKRECWRTLADSANAQTPYNEAISKK